MPPHTMTPPITIHYAVWDVRGPEPELQARCLNQQRGDGLSALSTYTNCQACIQLRASDEAEMRGCHATTTS